MVAAVDSLYRVVTEAIDDILRHGYDSQRRLDEWVEKIQIAIAHSLIPLELLDADLRKTLLSVFARTTRADRLMRVHNGVSKYTLEMIRPKLRAELDRRILASAQLIKLHRDESIARTLRRFYGWATSIPAGGSEVAKRTKVRKDLRKGIAGLPFEERRVIIDQGHKLSAAVNDLVAGDGGAIAFRWHSHWREAGYHYRPSHKVRDGKIYVIRDNWAMQKGLMKLAGREYANEITRAAEEPFCRCYEEFLYSLNDLPAAMLTERGREKLVEVRAQIGDWFVHSAAR